MGAGDLDDFANAGRILFSLRLVSGSEGNLSVWDGETIRITRTGCELSRLSDADVMEGRLDSPPANCSSDFAIHVREYESRGTGAIAHAHPPGTVREDADQGRPHGTYEFASTLDEAVRQIVAKARLRE